MATHQEKHAEMVEEQERYEQWSRAQVMESVADSLRRIADICGGNPYAAVEGMAVLEDSASFLGGAHGAALTCRWHPNGSLMFIFTHTDPKNTNAPCTHTVDSRGPFAFASAVIALAYDVLSRDWHNKV